MLLIERPSSAAIVKQINNPTGIIGEINAFLVSNIYGFYNPRFKLEFLFNLIVEIELINRAHFHPSENSNAVRPRCFTTLLKKEKTNHSSSIARNISFFSVLGHRKSGRGGATR